MRIIKALTQSYIWIGLGAASTYFYCSKLIIGLDFNPVYALLLFGSTSCLYNILGSFKRPLKLRTVTMTALTALISLGAIIKLSDLSLILYLIPSVIFGFMYGYKGGLRRVPYLKVFLIALIWVYTTVVIPILMSELVFELSQVFFTLSMVLFLIGITIPFDVRDITYDSPKIKTLPQVLGVKRSLLLSVLCAAISGFLTIYFMSVTGTLTAYYLVLLWIPVSVIAVGSSKNSRSNLYFTALIDGLLIFQGILAYIFC